MAPKSRSLPWIALALANVASMGGCMANGTLTDAERQAADFGISYDLTRSCAREDDNALRRFFLLSFAVDAAGADEYGSDLYGILKDIGESEFLRVLDSSGWCVKMQVLEAIRQDRGFGQEGDDWSRFVALYPGFATRPNREPGAPNEGE